MIIVLVAIWAVRHVSSFIKVDYISQRPVLVAELDDAGIAVFRKAILEVADKHIMDVAFNHEGDMLVATDRPGNLHVWRTFDWKVTKKFKQTPSLALDVSPDNTLVVSMLASDKNLMLVDLQTGEKTPLSDAPQWDICFNSDGSLLAGGGCDNTVRIWDMSAKRIVHEFVVEGGVNSIAFSPDETRIIGCSHLGSVVSAWDIETGTKLWGEVPDYWFTEGEVPDTLVSSSQNLAIAVLGGELRAYNLDNGTLAWTFPQVDPGASPQYIGIQSADLSSDESLTAAAGNSGTVYLIDPGNGVEIGRFTAENPDNYKTGWWCDSITFSRNGSMLAAGTDSGKVLVFSIKRWQSNDMEP